MKASAGALTAEPAPRLGARVSVLVAAVCGVFALISTALVATPHVAAFGIACAVVFAAAAWAPVLWPSPDGVKVRRLLSFVILATTMVLFVVNVVRLGPTEIADLAETFGGFLGRMLISVMLAQLFVTDKLRDLRVALLLATGMFVLAVANEPGAIVVVALLIGWPAVVTALAFAHAALEESKVDTVARASATSRSAGWARIGSFAVVSGLVALLAVLLVPHPEGVQPRSTGGASGDGLPRSTSAPAPRNPGAYTSGSLDMRARGKLPGTEVAEVPRESPVLWRGAVLDYYDGVSWRAPADGTYGRALAGGPHYDVPAGDTSLATGAERRDVVRRRAGFSGVLLAPGQPTAVDVDAALLRLSGGLFISAGADGRYPDEYTVTSRGTELARSQLLRTPVAAPIGSGVPRFALQLPSTVPERVRLLGESITASATDREAATRAVETYLRGHATYRLDSPVPPAGHDAVDHFLFVAHTGFCEQFAAAEVVLLRAAGVPARLATGFAGGEVAGDHRTLLGSDAHAWVEVWYPGIGWAASDPTAGTRLADSSPTDRISSWLRTAGGRLILAGCLLVATALAVLLAWWLRRWVRQRADRHGARRPARRPLPPVLAAFDRLQQALDDVGAPRAPAESVGELARRPVMAGAVSALAVVERTSYGARAPVGAEADDAERTLDELARQLREQAAERLAPRA